MTLQELLSCAGRLGVPVFRRCNLKVHMYSHTHGQTISSGMLRQFDLPYRDMQGRISRRPFVALLGTLSYELDVLISEAPEQSLQGSGTVFASLCVPSPN